MSPEHLSDFICKRPARKFFGNQQVYFQRADIQAVLAFKNQAVPVFCQLQAESRGKRRMPLYFGNFPVFHLRISFLFVYHRKTTNESKTYAFAYSVLCYRAFTFTLLFPLSRTMARYSFRQLSGTYITAFA